LQPVLPCCGPLLPLQDMTRNLVWCRPGHHPAFRAACLAPRSADPDGRCTPLQKLHNLSTQRTPPGRALQRRGTRQVWRGEWARGTKRRGRPSRPTGRPFSRRAPSLRLTQAVLGYYDLQEHGSNLEASDPSQQPLTHDDALSWLYQYGSFLCPIRISSPEWRQEAPAGASQTDAEGPATT